MTMSNPSQTPAVETLERLEQIRQRHLRIDCYKSQMRTDIDFLLSLLDSQAAELKRLESLLEDLGTLYGKPLSHEHADALWTGAVALMRDKCAAIARDFHRLSGDDFWQRYGTAMLVDAIEAATLDSTEKGEKKDG